MTSKLSFVSLSVISALLMLSFLATTTTNVYAQPQSRGNSNSQACPPGFELNRGVCQAPVIITTTEECPSNASISPQGNCYVGIASISNAICPSSHPFQYVGQAGCFNEAGETAPLVYQCPSYAEFEVDLSDPLNPRCLQLVDKITNTEESCPEGSRRNGDLCEVRPGNRAAAA
jgi:hypothetical protein